MATSNFHNVNASKIFAVELEDDFSFDWLTESVNEYMASQKGACESEMEAGGLRSCPATVLGEYYEQLKTGEYLQLKVLLRGGYYAGANIDYELCFEGTEYGSEEEIAIDYMNTLEREKGKCLTAREEESARKRIENGVSRMEKKFEKMASEFSDAYGVKARFSNGETMYEKI